MPNEYFFVRSNHHVGSINAHKSRLDIRILGCNMNKRNKYNKNYIISSNATNSQSTVVPIELHSNS